VKDLLLSDELIQSFLCALLSVCRADGDVSFAELHAIAKVADELRPKAPLDYEALLFSDVTPDSFAADVKKQSDGPFRAAASASAEAIGRRFVEVALAVVRADGHAAETEISAIHDYARALGVDEEAVARSTSARPRS
jgi:tellurite resistance protein